MEILLEHEHLPERGEVELNLHCRFQVNITAEEARRKVNFWLVTELSYMLMAAPPKLVIKEPVVWRVPILLTASHVGPVGFVGELDIDVQTGLMDITPEHKAAIEQRALQVAERLPPYQPHTTVSTPHVTTNKTSGRTVSQPELHPTY
jgi:hypothetical protein